MMDDNQYGTGNRQMELLSMMKDLHQILEKNNIEYSLCAGSLLGAIRHNGFIPWDDDMDIMTDRDNYNRLVSLFDKPINVDEREYVIHKELWINRVHRIINGKISDATIDIFVLDNCPDNAFKRKIKLLMLSFLQGTMHKNISLNGFSFLYKACLLVSFVVGRLIPYNLKWILYNKISQWSNGKKTECISCYNDLFKYISVRYPADMMHSIELHDFEGSSFPTIASYDKYLTLVYGDYMTPPAMSERVPQHM